MVNRACLQDVKLLSSSFLYPQKNKNYKTCRANIYVCTIIFTIFSKYIHIQDIQSFAEIHALLYYYTFIF